MTMTVNDAASMLIVLSNSNASRFHWKGFLLVKFTMQSERSEKRKGMGIFGPKNYDGICFVPYNLSSSYLC